MVSNWINTTIGDFSPFLYGKGLPEKTRTTHGIFPVYGSNGQVGLHSVTLTKGPTIIIGRKGSVGAVHFSKTGCWPIDTTFYVEPASHRDTRFTYYLLSSLGLEHMNSDSAVPGLNRDAVHARKIIVPSLHEQNAIARILGTLDNKIELNQQMNETLEEIARTIFQSWFVDFDPVRAKAAGRQPTGMDAETAALFPDSFDVIEGRDVPKGWNLTTFDKMISIIGGGTPKTSIPEYWSGTIPWFSVVDAPRDSDVFVIDTEKKITKRGMDESSTTLISQGTSIISARGTVGKCCIAGIPLTINQSCYGIHGKNGRSSYYTYFLLRNFVADLQQMSHGAVFDTITRSTFEILQAVDTPTIITEHYDKMVEPFLKHILSNLYQSQSLEEIRDTLLPKLLSGELRVSDAERFVEEHL